MIKKLARYYTAFETWFLTVLFMGAFVVVAIQSVSRYLFNSPIIWTDEVSTMLQMFMAFLGIGYGIRTKSHIRIDGIFVFLPKNAQRILSLIFDIAFILLCIVLIQDGIKYSMSEWNVSFGTFALDRGKAFLAVPTGYGLALLYSALSCIDSVRELCHKEPWFRFGEGEQSVTDLEDEEAN